MYKIFNGKLNIHTIGLSISTLFLAVNACFLTWYIFYGYQLSLNSDSAAEVLLAREIVKTGQYFPHDWNYVNGDLFVLFGHTWIIPLLTFMSAGYIAHAISSFISSVIILFGVWLVTGIVSKNVPKRLLVVAIFASGFSGFVAESLYGQVSYGFIFFFSCYLLFATWKFLEAKSTYHKYYGMFILWMLIMTAWANPLRALVWFILPLSAATMLYGYHSRATNTKKIINVFILIFIGFVLGLILHVITLASANNVRGVGAGVWLSYAEMLHNASLLLKQFLVLFNGLPPLHVPLTSIRGLYGAMNFIAVLSLIFLIIRSLRKACSEKISGAAFLAIYALISFTIVGFIEWTTSIPNMSYPISSSRYLIPSLLLLVILALSVEYDYKKEIIAFVVYSAVALVLVTGAYQTYIGQVGQRHATRLTDFLIKNNLHYGYATYWNAGVLSVMSNEKVLVRQIQLSGGLPVPMRHLSSNRWYRPRAWTGETFVLLSNNEVASFDVNRMRSFGGKIVRTLTFENFKVFVFEKNIALLRLPDWNRTYDTPMVFDASKYSDSLVGRLVDHYDKDGAALVAEKGESGALHYGPYVGVARGDYKVTFNVLSKDNKKGTMRLDVAASPDQKILAERVLTSSSGLQTLIIHVDKTRTLQFRVFALGTEQVVFKSVSIVRLQDKENK